MPHSQGQGQNLAGSAPSLLWGLAPPKHYTSLFPHHPATTQTTGPFPLCAFIHLPPSLSWSEEFDFKEQKGT